MVVNRKTATALGLAVPPSILLRAEKKTPMPRGQGKCRIPAFMGLSGKKFSAGQCRKVH
jgi:hypothetical protein